MHRGKQQPEGCSVTSVQRLERSTSPIFPHSMIHCMLCNVVNLVEAPRRCLTTKHHGTRLCVAPSRARACIAPGDLDLLPFEALSGPGLGVNSPAGHTCMASICCTCGSQGKQGLVMGSLAMSSLAQLWAAQLGQLSYGLLPSADKQTNTLWLLTLP